MAFPRLPVTAASGAPHYPTTIKMYQSCVQWFLAVDTQETAHNMFVLYV